MLQHLIIYGRKNNNTFKFLSLFLLLSVCGCQTKLKQTINCNKPTKKYFVFWYDNGNIENVQTWEGNKINGKCYSWYSNGRTKNMYTYKNDVLHGKFITWYEDGKKQSEGYYYNRYLAGRYLHWYKDGNLEEILLSDDGTELFFVKLFSKNGNLIAQCLYKNFKPWNGTLIKDGKILPIKYKDGKKINQPSK